MGLTTILMGQITRSSSTAKIILCGRLGSTMASSDVSKPTDIVGEFKEAEHFADVDEMVFFLDARAETLNKFHASSNVSNNCR